MYNLSLSFSCEANNWDTPTVNLKQTKEKEKRQLDCHATNFYLRSNHKEALKRNSSDEKEKRKSISPSGILHDWAFQADSGLKFKSQREKVNLKKF